MRNEKTKTELINLLKKSKLHYKQNSDINYNAIIQLQ